jgi:hypothetical protein
MSQVHDPVPQWHAAAVQVLAFWKHSGTNINMPVPREHCKPCLGGILLRAACLGP